MAVGGWGELDGGDGCGGVFGAELASGGFLWWEFVVVGGVGWWGVEE